jgi:hypothetical protein
MFVTGLHIRAALGLDQPLEHQASEVRDLLGHLASLDSGEELG